MKILDRLGTKYNPNHIHVQSCSSQVGHYNSIFEEHEDELDGDPQIVNLPFKCIEGALFGNNALWTKWHKKGGAVDFNNHCHEQFYNIMLMRVESQHT